MQEYYLITAHIKIFPIIHLISLIVIFDKLIIQFFYFIFYILTKLMIPSGIIQYT